MCIYIIKNKNINDFHPYNFVQYFVNSRLSVYSKCDSLLEKNEDLKEKNIYTKNSYCTDLFLYIHVSYVICRNLNCT